MKYLIVDDNEEMRKIIKETICTDQDLVIESYDGNDAVKKYELWKPDLVLMDIQMKTMSGIKATKAIHEQFPDSRILIVTNYDILNFRRAAMAAGAMAFFSKENLAQVKEFINKELLNVV